MGFFFLVKDVVAVLFCRPGLLPGLSGTRPLQSLLHCWALRCALLLLARSHSAPLVPAATYCPLQLCFTDMRSSPKWINYRRILSEIHGFVCSPTSWFTSCLHRVRVQSPARSPLSIPVILGKISAWDTSLLHLRAYWDTAQLVCFWHVAFFLAGEEILIRSCQNDYCSWKLLAA